MLCGIIKKIKKKGAKNVDNKNNLIFDTKKKLHKASKDTTQTGSLQYKKEVPVKEVKGPKQTKKKRLHSESPPEQPLTPKEKAKRVIIITICSFLGIFLSGVIILSMIIGNWLTDLPELDLSLLTDVSQTSLIYDKNKTLITSYSSYENREWANYEEIPKDLINAFVSVEDKRFFKHHGVDAKRFTGAILGQLTGQDDYGGSTITQQLIKNVYLTSEVTYKRKAQEIALAFNLERKLPKKKILEAYMNIIYLGGSNYGVKAAAKSYFNKDLDSLTTRECAMIAGLAQNPNGYNPKANFIEGDMSRTNKRTDTVLYAMYINEKLTREEYDAAMKEEVNIFTEDTIHEMYPYAHYVEYVLEEVAADLLEQEGKEVTPENLTYKKYAIRNGGYKIYTSLDPYIQETLQSTAANFDNYPKTVDGEGSNTSAVIMDHHTGEIVAMIGDKKEPIAQETFNKAVDSTQPVGSIMKPLGIFAPAIEKGASPASVVADYKTPIIGYDASNGYPGGVSNNYPMTMREALKISHNIPAARFLIDNVGLDTSINYLMQMGINKNHIEHNSAGIALGTSGITTLEATGAYATIANGGLYIEPHAYTIVLDKYDNPILDSKETKTQRRVFKESTAWLTADMMVDEATTGGGHRAKIKGITTAGKTGTHEDKCITFAGFTGYYTSVIRISSDNYSSMYKASGGRQTAILWNQYMSKIHEGLEDKPVQDKSAEDLGLIKVDVCNVSGKLATSACKHAGHSKPDYFVPGTEPISECDMHFAICSVTGKFASQGCWDSSSIKVITYVDSNNYLAGIDRNLLNRTLENYIDAKPRGYCDMDHFYVPPEPEEPEVPEIEEPQNDGHEDNDELDDNTPIPPEINNNNPAPEIPPEQPGGIPDSVG